MKSFIRVLFLVGLSLTLSCTNLGNKETQPQPEVTYVGHEVENESMITDISFLKRIQKRISRTIISPDLVSLDGSLNFDLEKTTRINYRGINVDGIIAPAKTNTETSSSKHFYVTYAKDNLIMKEGMILSMSTINGNLSNQEVKFYAYNGMLLGGFETKDGIVVDSYGSEVPWNKLIEAEGGYWDRFGNCVSAVLTAMTDGSAGNAVVALLCLVFGPECALGTGALCAVAAAEGYFAEE